MTYARILATGSGKLSYRVAITGLQYEAVTDLRMDANVGSKFRRQGLEGDSIQISERLHPLEAQIDASGTALRIVDVGNVWTSALSKRPAVLGYLTADATESATTLTVSDSASIPNGFCWIGSEVVNKTAAPTGTTITVTRHQLGTLAQRHYAPTHGEDARACPIFDGPPALEGQRVEVYAYGEGDSPTGNGTLIWRGVVVGAPELDDTLTTWSLRVEPITYLLKQDVAADADKGVRLRGRYYPWSGCFYFIAREHAGASSDSAFGTESDPVQLSGFFETTADLATALQTEIDTVCAGLTTYSTGGRIFVHVDAADGLYFEIVTGSTPRYIHMQAFSPVDGYFGSNLQRDTGDVLGDVETVDADTSYFKTPVYDTSWLDPRFALINQAPSSWLAGDVADRSSLTVDSSAAATAPANRVYLADALTNVAIGDGVIIVGDLDLDGEDEDVIFEVASVDNTDRYVGLAPGRAGLALGGDTVVTLARSYGRESDVAGFRDALVDASVAANLGGTPFVTDSDLDDWESEVQTAHNGRRFLARRDYVFTKPASLDEVLAHELRLLSMYPYVTAAGKINVKRLRAIAGTEPTSFTIDTSEQIVSAGFGRWERNREGTTNVAIVKTGFDARKDSYAQEFVIRNVESISQRKRRRTLEVAPKSRESDDVPITWEEIVDAMQTAVTLLADDHVLITVDVTRRLFASALLGSYGSVTNARFPDPETGLRGVTDLPVLVVGREWLGRQPWGTLTLLALPRAFGYAPTARVVVGGAGTSHLGGNVWAIATTAAHYGDGTIADVEYFTVGDKGEIVEQDSYTPSTQTGTVQSISAPGIVVALDGAAPGTFPATGEWNLEFRTDASGHTPADAQERYVYIADSAALLYDGSTARRFSA